MAPEAAPPGRCAGSDPFVKFIEARKDSRYVFLPRGQDVVSQDVVDALSNLCL